MKERSYITFGILANVDAGKTTLSEGVLYYAKMIKNMGRVDKQDAYLDNNQIEKDRGITVFSKQAIITTEDICYVLIDTPGHADFGAETERVLSVLDYAIFVISATDGIGAQSRRLFELLEIFDIPTFIFVNKIDLAIDDKSEILSQIKDVLGDNVIDITDGYTGEIKEEIALCDDNVLSKYLSTNRLEKEDIVNLILERKFFPCVFGSALKMKNVDKLFEYFKEYTKPAEYPDEFSARVFKITRDDKNNRLTHLKVTGGKLRVKQSIKIGDTQEKVNEIRIYSSDKYKSVQYASKGCVCAVTGLDFTYPNQGIGENEDEIGTHIKPHLLYEIVLDDGEDVFKAYEKLKEFEQEDPMLFIEKNDDVITAAIMGDVQLDIITELIKDRYGLNIRFSRPRVIYKETIAKSVIGVGHYEPLRHYAEVHLRLDPLERGEGIVIKSECSQDVLSIGYQKNIISYLEDIRLKGVLTGADITDIKITLISGRAHEKHTEGADMRQAALRALRQGLMSAENILLEPYLDFRVETATEYIGRVMSDLNNMGANYSSPENDANKSILRGVVPAAAFGDYTNTFISYTHGAGVINTQLLGYDVCNMADEVIKKAAYDPGRDLENPSYSVFCIGGAASDVPWDRAYDMMHLPVETIDLPNNQDTTPEPIVIKESKDEKLSYEEKIQRQFESEKELEQIFEKTYGKSARRDFAYSTPKGEAVKEKKYKGKEKSTNLDTYMLVDGYNVIHASKELHELAAGDLKAARDLLLDKLSNFQGLRDEHIIVVFDAYLVSGGVERLYKYHNIDVVFTKEAETADQYIEKAVHNLKGKYNVIVASSDGIEQIIIMGAGGRRMSSRELWALIEYEEGYLRDEMR